MNSDSSPVSRRVFLGLGSNLGDRWTYLRDAVASFPDVVKVSSVYETEPLDVPDVQGAYLNAVVELDTDLGPAEILELARDAETAAQRTRETYHGARTLDVDVLLIGDETIRTADLEVPHPRMWSRRFVVEPLAEIAPDLVPPNWLSLVTGEAQVAGTL